MAKKASGSGADTIIKLVLIFFISLLSFSVGTFVGKQVSDADYRRAAIEGEYNHFQANSDHDEQGGGEVISEDEIASLTEEFVNTEKRELASDTSKKKEHHGKTDKHNDHNKPDAHAKNDDHDKHDANAKEGYKKYGKATPSKAMKEKAVAQKELIKEEKGHSVEKAARRVASGKAPAKTIKETRKPTSVLPGVASSAVGKYTVQVASYADEGEAKAHSAKLKTKGWNAFYIPADVKGRTWYRVSVGLFSTTASAEKFKSELKKEANISSAYVQKIIR